MLKSDGWRIIGAYSKKGSMLKIPPAPFIKGGARGVLGWALSRGRKNRKDRTLAVREVYPVKAMHG
jgi:hypothetical protein